MSSAELLEKIELLAPDEFDLIVALVNKFTNHAGALKQLSEEELIEQLSESVKRSDQGFTKPAEKVSAAMRKKYAV